MYITILQHGDVSRVLTFELPAYTKAFQSEDWEEYMTNTLNVGSGHEWMVHDELPEISSAAFSRHADGLEYYDEHGLEIKKS